MAFRSNNSEMTYTVQDFIDSDNGLDEITYYNFSLLEVLQNGEDTLEISYSNIIDDYLDELIELSIPVTMSSIEKNKYFYNPDLLAYDLYGSTELGFIIMKLNRVIDPKDFDMPNIILIQRSILSEIISDIYSAELLYINTNREMQGIS